MAFMNKIRNIMRQTQPSISNALIFQAIRSFSSSKLFIGGLSYATDENSLREAFVPYGDVVEARVIVDRETGRSRGFGFVSYPSVEEASAAIQALDGRDLHGRFIRVAYASGQRGASCGSSFSSGVGYVTADLDNHCTGGSGSTGGYGSAGDGYGGQHLSTVGGSNGGNGYAVGNAGHHGTGHGGANSFNKGGPYGSTGQEHDPWQGNNLDNDNNSYTEIGTDGNPNARGLNLSNIESPVRGLYFSEATPIIGIALCRGFENIQIKKT